MEPEYIGVYLHKQFLQVCALTASGRAWETRLPRSPEGIMAFCGRCGPTRTWPWKRRPRRGVRRCGAADGRDVCVVDTRKTKLKAGFAAKTDRLDARRLADALRRESVVSVYIPPPPIRELREFCRGRHQVVRLRCGSVR